jgi:uncharacterized protein (DUF2267 family)
MVRPYDALNTKECTTILQVEFQARLHRRMPHESSESSSGTCWHLTKIKWLDKVAEPSINRTRKEFLVRVNLHMHFETDDSAPWVIASHIRSPSLLPRSISENGAGKIFNAVC